MSVDAYRALTQKSTGLFRVQVREAPPLHRFAGVAQLFRVRNACGISQGNLPTATGCRSRSSGVAGRDLSLPGQGSNLFTNSTFVKISVIYAGVAQLFRALPCQGRGHELESRHPHQPKSPAGPGFLLGMSNLSDSNS